MTYNDEVLYIAVKRYPAMFDKTKFGKSKQDFHCKYGRKNDWEAVAEQLRLKMICIRKNKLYNFLL